eukprot:COSAG02_NODE_53147_length_303_cov_1.259804_1_plen_33_part_01
MLEYVSLSLLAAWYMKDVQVLVPRSTCPCVELT